LLLVAFLLDNSLVNASNCHLSLVLALAVQGEAVNCNTSYPQFWKKTATPQKTSPNSRENRTVGNTDAII